MYRFLRAVLLFFFFTLVYATENKGKIEILAKDVNATKTTISTTKGVVVYYKDSVIKADHATYDKIKKRLILEGNVESIGYKGTKEHTQYMQIDTEHNEVYFKKLFLTNENDVWLYAQKGYRHEGNYTLEETILSSCEVDHPLWHMRFSHSLYDSEKQYMKIYSAKVYFMDAPIFYFPYLAFSTSKERSTGFLFPLFGYVPDEGFVYEQPFFWAINQRMDIELNPQIRTKRSYGGYATLRFVDTDHSSGKLRVGYFKDKSDYVAKHHLKDDKHYGVEFNYEASRLFTDSNKSGYHDGLYINSTYLNDIDYLNLQKRHLNHFGLVPIQESRLNYFLYNDSYYSGLNAKYFIDTRRENNDKTIQILPAIQLHKYLSALLADHLTYSVDVQTKNLYRKAGTTLMQTEVKVPIEFTVSLLADYLKVSAGEDLYYSNYQFDNGKFVYNDFTYYANIHRLKLFSDLTKRYGEYIHVMQPSLEYIKPGSSHESPVIYNKLSSEQRSLFNVAPPEEVYDFSISNYVYDHNAKLKFYQHLSQKYYPNRAHQYTDLSNEMLFNIQNWTLYNYIEYAPESNSIREASTSISLTEKRYKLMLSHTYRKTLSGKAKKRKVNNLDFQMKYVVNDHINIGAAIAYDIDDAASRQWSLGGTYHQNCWSMDASIRQDIIPRPTGFSKDNTFYVQFNFIPFG
ncbi:MAG: LPS-assembly protein LptD, partial [Sulfurovum sp.]